MCRFQCERIRDRHAAGGGEPLPSTWQHHSCGELGGTMQADVALASCVPTSEKTNTRSRGGASSAMHTALWVVAAITFIYFQITSISSYYRWRSIDSVFQRSISVDPISGVNSLNFRPCMRDLGRRRRLDAAAENCLLPPTAGQTHGHRCPRSRGQSLNRKTKSWPVRPRCRGFHALASSRPKWTICCDLQSPVRVVSHAVQLRLSREPRVHRGVFAPLPFVLS